MIRIVTNRFTTARVSFVLAVVMLLGGTSAKTHNALLHGHRILQEGIENPIVNVRYEYQMDVNPAGSSPTIAQGVDELEANVQTRLDDFINQVDEPPVTIVGISSEQQDTPCTPSVEGYTCAIVESIVTVEVFSSAAGDVIEKATVEQVQIFVDEFNQEREGSIVVTFIGPFFVSTEIVLELSPVDGEMVETEIALLEGNLFDILEPALRDGDPPSIDLETVEVLYQDLIPLETTRSRRLQGNRLFRNEVHLYVTGQCRGCNNGDLTQKTNDAVDANADQLREDLKQDGQDNGTDYFDDVDTVQTATPDAIQPPPDNPPDFVPEVDEDNDPFWIWILLGGALGLLALTFGVLFYKKKRGKQLQHGEAYYGGSHHESSNHDGREVVMGSKTYETNEEVPHDDSGFVEEAPEVIPNPDYQDEGVRNYYQEPVQEEGVMPGSIHSSTGSFGEGPSSSRHGSIHSTGSYTGHSESDRNVFAEVQEEEDGNVFRHPQPRASMTPNGENVFHMPEE